MTIVLTKGTESKAYGLLGQPARDLRLRISRDNGQAAETIEIGAPTWTVGAARSCGLRVDEPGVAPVECLIVRGEATNVVRWFGSDAEGFFEDEVLRAGEQIQVGSVELEVLPDLDSGSEQTRSADEDQIALYETRLARLERQLAEIQRPAESEVPDSSPGEVDGSTVSIGELTQQLVSLQENSDREQEQWAAEKSELEERLDAVTELRDDVQRLHQDLAVARQQSAHANQMNDRKSDELEQLLRQFDDQALGFQQREAEWMTERRELESSLEQHAFQIAGLQEQLKQPTPRQTELEVGQQAADAEAQQLRETLDRLSSELAEQRAESETMRGDWEKEREALELRLQESESERQSAETSADAQIDELQKAWEHERTGLLAQLEQADAGTREVDAELNEGTNVEMQSVEEHQQQDEKPGEEWTAEALPEQLEASPHVGQAEATFDAPQHADEHLVEPAEEGPFESHELPPSELEAPFSPIDRFLSASSLADDDNGEPGEDDFGALSAHNLLPTNAEEVDSSLAATSEFCLEEPASEIGFEDTSPDAPVNTAEILAGFSQSGSLPEDGHESHLPQTEESMQSERFGIGSQASSQPPVGEAALRGAADSDRTAGEDSEESIEDYMARLMQRVRTGDADESASQMATPNVERSPITEYEAAAEEERPIEPEPEPIDPEQYRPRSAAPERNLDAMRALANDSRRAAIASHAKRNWTSVMKLKILVSVFTVLAVSASIVFFWGNPPLMGLGAVIGLSVLLYWSRQALIYRKLLMESLMLDTGPSDQSSDAVANDVSDDQVGS
jgi:hypothetical protein